MRKLFLFIFLAVANIAFGQDTWHRLYNKSVEPSEDYQLIDIDNNSGSSIIMGYTQLEDRKDTTTVFFSDISSNSGKISDQFKLDRDFGNNVKGAFSKNDETYAFILKSDLDEGKLYHGFNNNDELILIETEEESEIIDHIKTEDSYWSVRANDTEFYIDAYEWDHNRKFSKKYKFEESDVVLEDVHYSAVDSTVWATGVFAENDIWVCQLDKDGNILQNYTLESNRSSLEKLNIVATSDTTYVVSALGGDKSYLYFGQQDSVSMRSLSFTNMPTEISDMDFNGKVIIGGYLEQAKDEFRHFSSGFSVDGTELFTTLYRNDVKNPIQKPLLAAGEGEYSLVGQAYPEGNTSQDMMVLFKHNDQGSALCSTFGTIVYQTIIEGRNQMDNRKPDVSDYSLKSTEEKYILGAYDVFYAPIVIIEKPECIIQPINEPIEAILQGVPEDKVKYKWSSGQTTPKITATKVGEPYVLTTTVDYQECYILKDTVVLEESKSPVVTINPSFNDDCTFNLRSIVTQGGTAPYTYEWNNGTTGPTLQKATDGQTYSVKVTDKCQLGGVASLQPEFPTPVISFDATQNPDCTADITAIYDNAIPPVSLEWNSGETTETININKDGTYEVTLNSKCIEPTTASINFKIVCEITDCVAFPNAFFPEGKEELEKTFGPVIRPGCSSDVSIYRDYEFAVYDRWGTQVFSTNTFTEQWDGGNHPNEVYIWYAKFKVGKNDDEVTLKGDVTLFR